jgi:hypothetical protein
MSPYDEQLIYSKHVEEGLFEQIKKDKCILLVFIKQVFEQSWSCTEKYGQEAKKGYR